MTVVGIVFIFQYLEDVLSGVEPIHNRHLEVHKNEFVRSVWAFTRFINVNDFRSKLDSMGYKILYIKESVNFAKLKSDKPSVCRIIFKR